MSQVEVDARVKAIQEDLKNGIEVDREELIHNYGLTMDDYERSVERLNKEEMKRTTTQLPLKIKIAKVNENNQKDRINNLLINKLVVNKLIVNKLVVFTSKQEKIIWHDSYRTSHHPAVKL